MINPQVDFPAFFKAGFSEGEPNGNLEEEREENRCDVKAEKRHPGPQFSVFLLTSLLHRGVPNSGWLQKQTSRVPPVPAMLCAEEAHAPLPPQPILRRSLLHTQSAPGSLGSRVRQTDRFRCLVQ